MSGLHLAHTERRTALLTVAAVAAASTLGAAVSRGGARPAVVVIVGIPIAVLAVLYLRVTTVVAFSLLPWATLTVPGLPLPLNECALAALLVAVGIRSPKPQVRPPRWLVSALGFLFFAFMVSAALNGLLGPDSLRRLAHVALFCGLVYVLASGRLDRTLVTKGLLWGLIAAIAAGLAGYAPAGYTGRLTGLFGDPNLAGYYLVVLGPLALTNIVNPRQRWVAGAAGVAVIVATLSRTSLAALAIGLVFVVVRRYASTALAVVVAALLITAVVFLPANLRTVGPFESRVKSDILRSAILKQEHVLVSSSPLYGYGPGKARVTVNGIEGFFFHNSYLSLVTEVGLLGAAAYGLLLFGSVVATLRSRRRDVAIEFALAGLIVCALSLGEVLLELPAAVVIGLALAGASSRATPMSTGASSRMSSHLPRTVGPAVGSPMHRGVES